MKILQVINNSIYVTRKASSIEDRCQTNGVTASTRAGLRRCRLSWAAPGRTSRRASAQLTMLQQKPNIMAVSQYS